MVIIWRLYLAPEADDGRPGPELPSRSRLSVVARELWGDEITHVELDGSEDGNRSVSLGDGHT